MIREAVVQKDALYQLHSMLTSNKKPAFENLERSEFFILARIVPVLNLFETETKRVLFFIRKYLLFE